MVGLSHEQLLELGFAELQRDRVGAFQALRQRLTPLGFHATLTHCWLGLLSLSIDQGLNAAEVRRRLSFSQLPLGFYSAALLDSPEAIQRPDEPDLRPLALPPRLAETLLVPLLAFQARTITAEEWTHDAHLTVAAALYGLMGSHGVQAMTGGIQRLNSTHGVPQTPERGYHDTLTRLWYRLVGEQVERLSLVTHPERLPELLRQLSDRKLPLQYYRRETLNSWEARIGWVPPDLA